MYICKGFVSVVVVLGFGLLVASEPTRAQGRYFSFKCGLLTGNSSPHRRKKHIEVFRMNGTSEVFNNLETSSEELDLARFPPYAETFRRRCPLCDSSVYSYCSEKLFHDSCCCHNPNNPYDRIPYQCQFADCSFLHANSCQEHKLITACCCIRNTQNNVNNIFV